MTGMSYKVAVVVVVMVVTTYSVLGGLWSVTLTDVVQWWLIVLGLIVAVPFAVKFGGGWENLMAQVPEGKMHLTEGMGAGTLISLVIMYVASFAVGQEAVQRYYAARDGRAARWGSVYAGVVYVVFAFVPALLGVIAFALVQNGAIDGALIQEQGERYVLPVLAVHVLPSWLVGIVFAALISATMSSADSDLLAAGSIFSNDVYARTVRKHASEKEILAVTRVAMVVIAALAMWVALTNTKNMITILMFSFTLRAGGAFIPYVLGHYWRKAGPAGALGSIILGSLTVVLAEREVIPCWGLEPILPGLAVSLLAWLGFSLWFPNPRNSTALIAEE
jgi:SSS family solute:Na+ symporter